VPSPQLNQRFCNKISARSNEHNFTLPWAQHRPARAIVYYVIIFPSAARPSIQSIGEMFYCCSHGDVTDYCCTTQGRAHFFFHPNQQALNAPR
jgi:hypothetical protein